MRASARIKYLLTALVLFVDLAPGQGAARELVPNDPANRSFEASIGISGLDTLDHLLETRSERRRS